MFEDRPTFNISEAAEKLGVTPNWLRFGERLGSLPLARRRANGWRFYTAEDLERLRRLGVGSGKQRSAVSHDG